MMHNEISKSKSGFTLVEVLLSIVLVSYVVTLIFRAFFVSLGAIDEAGDRLDLLYHMHDKMLNVKLAVESDEPITASDQRGVIEIANKPFYYNISASRVAGIEALKKIDAAFYWFEGSRRISLSRQFFGASRKKDDSS